MAKFVNWFFQQQNRDDEIGNLAKQCIMDKNFPIKSKHFIEIVDYVESTASDLEIETLNQAWQEYRTLPKVETIPLNQNLTKINS